MLNTLRINSLCATGLKSALATLLLAASPWAAAAPVTVDLCATAGTTSGSAAISPALPVYGYALGACPATPLSVPGGPVISVNEGDVVTVNLQNALLEASGLVFMGQTMVPDTTGAPAAANGVPGSKSYSFTASKAGTYLYQAAPIVSAEHQVAMGLYGALVVRPNVTFTATGVSIARTDAAAQVSVAGANEVIDAAALATDVGSAVTGTGVAPGTTITVVTPGVSFTMSNPATADGTGVVITRTDAAATVTNASTTVSDAGVLASDVGSAVSGGGILAGTTIASVSAGTSFVMSQAAQPAAYDANTVVDEESVLVLSEIDPALNMSADPTGFDMRSFAPKYFLINGKVYPDTAEVASAATHKLLLRYVNAGSKHHSMAALGLRQNFIAKDARLLPTSSVSVTAETLAPGQTGDALVTMPATAGKFALYDANLALHNDAGAGMGGMLTFVNATPGASATGPTVANVVLTPATLATGSSALSADATSSVANVTAAEYFIDTKGVDGGGTAMSGASFGAPATAISGLLDVTAMVSGKHTIYVHAQDSNGAWGSYNFAVLNVDKTGPTSSALALTPNPSNGTSNVTLTASASDVASGGSKVTAARYSIDGGATVAMTGAGVDATVRSFSASIPPASLAAGVRTISVQAQDELGNWGSLVSTQLTVTTAGPTTVVNSISPNPTNGIQGANSSSSVVRVTATMTSTGAKIAGAEAFIDTVGANGSGFPFVPSDGQFGAPTDTGTESGYGDIPLTTVALLAAGDHTIYVHGRDTAGNWGTTASGTLVVNKSAPTVSNVLLVPPYTNNGSVVITATASDAATGNNGIAGGEYFIDTVGAIGTGTSMTFTNGALRATIPGSRTGALAVGVHTVYVRARDGAANANWSATMGAALTIDRTRPTFVSLTRNGVSPTNAGSVSYTVRFSEPVINVGQNDFDVVRSPGGNSNLQISGSGATRVVTISGYGNNFVGTVGLNVRANATISDLAGNAWLPSAQTGQPYVVDRAGPTFTGISITPTAVTSGTSVSLTVSGASDGTGGVGVAGGEWWIRQGAGTGGQNIPPGTGTAFAASAGTTSGITVTTTGLAAGNYTVRVRMRDALGNWSGGQNGVRVTALRVN